MYKFIVFLFVVGMLWVDFGDGDVILKKPESAEIKHYHKDTKAKVVNRNLLAIIIALFG